MKYILTCLIACLCISIQAQENTTNYVLKNSDLKIKSDYASILIESSKTDQLELVTNATLNGVQMADLLDVDWDSNSQTLLISANFKKVKKMSKAELDKLMEEADCEEIKSSWKKNGNAWGNYNFNTEVVVRVPKQVSSLNINSTYGSIDVNHKAQTLHLFSTYGSVEVQPNTGCNNCDLESTYGSVSLNANSKANSDITLQSNYGDIYTDIDFDINKEKSENEMFHSVIVGTLNKGGQQKIHLRSDYSNVYLRGN
ncbi:MAG: DUF4097 family beta strand repeat protein [Saprospiraceae bacterium]|nr:DUF4097 family beta strand repeat protein [Saprospiraceae bacterium]